MTVSFFEARQNMVKSTYKNTGRGYMPSWASWSIREASEKTGYHPEYIRQLLSSGKVEGEKLGQMWLVKIDSLLEYIKSAEQANDGRFGPHKR